MRPTDNNIGKSIKKLHVPASAQLDEKIDSEISRASVQTKNNKSAQYVPNIWRMIMKSRITKPAIAAVIIITVGLLSITLLDKSVAPAYGITDALNVHKNARTIHIHGWAYLPIRSKQLQEFVKVPFEHWFELETGCFKIIKPGDLDKTGKPKYFTTVSDGQYIMKDSYVYPLDGEPYKSVHFERLSAFQSRLQAHNTSYNFLMQMFGGVDKINNFVNVGNELVRGVECDIWEGEITSPAPKGEMEVKIKSWLSPYTGEITKVQTWRKPAKSDKWISMYEIDQIELNVELPAGIFMTEPPEDCRLDNTKETAPWAELGNKTSVGTGDLMMSIHVAFTLLDGSVIVCWRSTDKNQPSQEQLFREVEFGGDLPKLPLEIYALKPISNSDVEYRGYHLTYTKMDNKFFEWSIYVPKDEVPERSSIVGYQVIHRYNTSKNKIVGSLSLTLHDDIQIDTEKDFNIWIIGAMEELSDNKEIPDIITYETVQTLARKIKRSVIQ
jgi:hypothetical protein